MKILSKSIIIVMSMIFIGNTSIAESNRLSLLIDEAVQNNPSIHSAYSRWKADEHKVTPARSLPDPTFTYSYFGEKIETRVGPQEHKFSASIKVPFPTKLTYRGRVKERAAHMSEEDYEAVKRDVIRDIKTTYYDIFWVDRAILIVEGEKAILGNLESVAKKRYEVKEAHQQDVVKAQVEISKLIDRLYMLRENRKTLVARINSLLNRERHSQFKKVTSLGSKSFDYTLEELRDNSLNARQELKRAEHAIKKAEYEKSLAKLNYVPNFKFGFDYTLIGNGRTGQPNDGQNAWRGIVSINVPIWFHKMRSQVKEKKASLKASKRNYTNVKNRVMYEVEDIYYKIQAYKDVVDLHENVLIPQTEQAFDAARIAYESGKVDFLNWLDSERTLLQTRLAYYRALVDYKKAIADLESAVGRSL